MYLIIDDAGGYIEEEGINKYLVFDSMELQMKTKSYLKNTMFLMELETKSKK